MATMQIQITDAEQSGLRSLAEGMGKSQEELIHDALRRLFDQEGGTARVAPGLSDEERLTRMRAAWGMWADHTELPGDIHEWRKRQERQLPEWP